MIQEVNISESSRKFLNYVRTEMHFMEWVARVNESKDRHPVTLERLDDE